MGGLLHLVQRGGDWVGPQPAQSPRCTKCNSPPINTGIRRRREAIFGHVARMSPNIPAHQALRLQVETSLGRRPDRDWVRSSGRPRNRWIDQLRQDHQRPPADLWRGAIQRGHTGATLRSSTTTRWRRRRPINGSVPITALQYNGPLRCGFNMGIKGLRNV